MRSAKTIILERSDLLEASSGKNILLITISDFLAETTIFTLFEMALFIDSDGKTKILKNRWGDNGNKIYVDIINDIKQNCIDNNIGLGEEYFDQIIEIIK